ncbi:MAG TPA: phage portal protein [Candidatus Paceibacterota bacterium]
MDDLISRARVALWGRRAASGVAARQPKNLAPVPYVSDRAALWDSSPNVDIGDRIYSAYGSVGTLFAIVRQIFEAFAAVEWHLFQRTSVRDKSRRREILGSSFMDVWNMPNPFMTGRFFRESCQQHLELVGETDILLVTVGGIVIEMWPVRPDRLRPVKSPTAFLTGWIYTGPDGEEVPLTLDQVLQIKLPNPADPYRGMGPVQAMLSDIDAARYSAEWNRNFFINGARPGGIIKVDYKMDDEEFEAFVNRWRRQHQGTANAHRVAVLENATWQDVQFSMEDMQFVELRNLPRELIREAFAFPKPMLGTVDDVNRANAQAGKEIMAENLTIPRLARWKDTINNFLLPRFAGGQNMLMDFDDPTPMNHDQANAQLAAQTSAFKTLIDAGVEPDDAALVCGLPPMNMVAVAKGLQTAPTPQPGAPDTGTDTPDQPTPDSGNRRNRTVGRRNMPVIDLTEDDYWPADRVAISA